MRKVAFAFDVDLDDEQRAAFLAREPEYRITSWPFHELTAATDDAPAGTGVICAASRDAALPAHYVRDFVVRHQLPSVWHWPRDSGLLPADVYLRHCLLAHQKAGGEAERSFLHDTYLCDRTTTTAIQDICTPHPIAPRNKNTA